MKTANVFALSSFFLASLVAAAPLKKRDYIIVTKTKEIIQTIDVTTTVWVDAPTGTPNVNPTSIGGLFYEHPSVASSVAATSVVASSIPAYTPVAAPVASSAPAYVAPSSSSSAYVAPASTYTPSSTPAYTPPAPSTTETPTPAYTPPTSTSVIAAAATSAGAAPATHYSGDITYYNPAGGYGSCGWTIQDSDPVVALAHGMMGEQSNGNPWCGKKISILHDGVTHTATIGDKCGGCEGESIDLTAGLWAIVAPDVDGRAHNVEWWVNE
jgi:hypothetical protein